MSGCCGEDNKTQPVRTEDSVCPQCKDKGKAMKIITLKSLLLPESLAGLEPQSNYRMCRNQDCSVVYFNEEGSTFLTTDLKVPVFPKSQDEDSPICYCFGWTKSKLKTEIEHTGTSSAISSISEHIKAGRCGCDVNNPEGSCCLGNVKKVVYSLTATKLMHQK